MMNQNRMISSTVKATYQYDFMGRRVRKQVGNTVTWYVYDGFNELGRFTQNSTSAPAIERTYTWGLDISNTPQGAGGVGGLLAVKVHGSTSATYYPTYDANGNISEYIAPNGSVAAHFEYDGFGNTVINTDTNGLFDYRFSTKPLEDVTGFYYYTYRHYDPQTGRWLSRDPIEERGGIDLYGFVGNDGVNRLDHLGLKQTIILKFTCSGEITWTCLGDPDPKTEEIEKIAYKNTTYSNLASKELLKRATLADVEKFEPDCGNCPVTSRENSDVDCIETLEIRNVPSPFDPPPLPFAPPVQMTT
jgi:RHS repeat-associated protein